MRADVHNAVMITSAIVLSCAAALGARYVSHDGWFYGVVSGWLNG